MSGHPLTLREFLHLPETQQYNVLFDLGVVLERRYEIDKEFVLYAVNRFYVELEYEEEQNLIIGKHAFMGGAYLDSYISMDLDRLLEDK